MKKNEEKVMRYLALTIQCKILDQGVFPRYKGSMLRGVLGACLHKAVCMTRKADCSQCMLHRSCIFTRLFTASFTGLAGESAGREQAGKAPLLAPPYCIEPPLDEKLLYEPGEVFTFGLKLFSYATEYLPYFIHAISLAGKRGMGRRTALGGGRFVLENIYHNDVAIYDDAKEILLPCASEPLDLPGFQIDQIRRKQILEVNFLTPLRFKLGNRLSSDLSFMQFITLVVRRTKNLWALDGKDAWLENYSEGMEFSKNIALVKNDLHWQDWTRYSGRQHTTMKMGGLLGRVQYEGEFGPFIELLDFAVKAHMGKQTSFGLGAFGYTLKELP